VRNFSPKHSPAIKCKLEQDQQVKTNLLQETKHAVVRPLSTKRYVGAKKSKLERYMSFKN